MLTETQQFERLIQQSKHILICFSDGNNIDAVASALSLKKYLKQEKKQVDIVCEKYQTNKNIRFINGYDKIKNQISNLQKLIIKVDISKAKIDTLSYDINDNWLSIHLNPKKGVITKQNLRTAQTALKYDLVITIGTPDLESLGSIFLNNTDLFYSVPIVNIDNNLGNEHYGQINFCKLKVACSAEIIYEIIKEIDETKIDSEFATAILTGMISSTRSFKTDNVTPKILNKAGELMDRGADRDKIIKFLYHTKSISTLKLWGRTLTRIKNDHDTGLVWSVLTGYDFIKTGADKEDLNDIIEELIGNSPEAKMILLLHEAGKNEKKNKIYGLFVADKDHDAKEILKQFDPTGTKHKVNFCIEDKNLLKIEEEIIEIIKKQTSKK